MTSIESNLLTCLATCPRAIFDAGRMVKLQSQITVNQRNEPGTVGISTVPHGGFAAVGHCMIDGLPDHEAAAVAA